MNERIVPLNLIWSRNTGIPYSWVDTLMRIYDRGGDNYDVNCINYFRKKIRRKETIEPFTVDSKTLYILDGSHRMVAARLEKKQWIKVKFSKQHTI